MKQKIQFQGKNYWRVIQNSVTSNNSKLETVRTAYIDGQLRMEGEKNTQWQQNKQLSQN